VLKNVSYVNLSAQWAAERAELLPIIDEVMSSGQYIGGKYVEEFEQRAAEVCQTTHCVSLNSGTDALVFGLVALGVKPGDEVITPPNSFIASTAAILHIGAKPVFVDVLSDQNIDPTKIEAVISKRTKAIMPIHLSGRMADMDAIQKISSDFGIPIIEDAAQAIGSKYRGRPSGKWGKVGCFSTHPLKNLNACGDGGFLVTDDETIANQVRLLRNHGLLNRDTATRFGYVSRMDAIQAAILTFRIARIESVTAQRRTHAALYHHLLNPTKIFIPSVQSFNFHSYHTFVIQVANRDSLRQKMADAGIETSIHYPTPIHLQPAAAKLGYALGDFPVAEMQSKRILTLPVHQYLTKEEITRIANMVNLYSEYI